MSTPPCAVLSNVTDAISLVKNWLASLAQDQTVITGSQYALSRWLDRTSANKLTEFLTTEFLTTVGFEQLPTVQVVSRDVLQGSTTIYDADGKTIYLSREFVLANTNQPEAIASALLVEVSTRIDSTLQAANNLRYATATGTMESIHYSVMGMPDYGSDEVTVPSSVSDSVSNSVSNLVQLGSLVRGTNQVLVKLRSGLQTHEVEALQASMGATVSKTIAPLELQLWTLSSTSADDAVAQFANHSAIAYIEPNRPLSLAATIPRDPKFNQLWGLHNTGQSGGKVDADIDALEAWGIQTGNQVVIGVIDTGVDYTHPDLQANMWTNPGEIPGNNIDDDGNGYVDDYYGYDFINNDSDPFDDHGHGTHVAGTIAASGNNNIGITGVAWSAKIMALKFLGPNGGTVSDAIEAINYASMMGAKITNNSWGGVGYSQAMYDAIAAAGAKGGLFIAAAGNSTQNTDITPHYPASYTLDNIISVAATDRNDNLSSFSNYGAKTVDLAAPGSSIYSTIPGGRYTTYSGTSMAAPHVSGVAALVWAENPSMTAQEVKARILNTVDPLASLKGKTVTGGRLNAYNAVANTPYKVTLTIADVSILEGDSGTKDAVFTVLLSEASAHTVTVKYTTEASAGSATAGLDYMPTTGTLTINPGETSKTIAVPVLGDTLPEADEHFYLDLLNPVNAKLGNPWAVGTIRDNDKPTISINSVDVKEGNSGITNAAFTVSLSKAVALEVSVQFTTEYYPASATSGVDYIPTVGTLTFAPGETTKSVVVPVIGDTLLESDELFYLDLLNPVNGMLSSLSWGVGRILNDDMANLAPEQLQFSPSKASYSVGETLGLVGAWVYDGNGTSDLARVNFWIRRPDGVWDDVADALSFTPALSDPNWAKFDSYSLSLTGYTPGTYTLWGMAKDAAGASSNAFETSFTIVAGGSGSNLPPTELQFNTNKANYSVGETLTLPYAWVYDGNGTSDLARVNFWVQRPDGVWDDVADALSFTPALSDPNWAKFDSYSLSLTGYTPGTYTLWGQAWDKAGAHSTGFQTSFTVTLAGGSTSNIAPVELQFSTDKTSYGVGELLKLPYAWVYDGNGASDLLKVNFWVQRPDGVWDDVVDATTFTPALSDSNWARFDGYGLSLEGYAPGNYLLWGMARDVIGTTSNEFIQWFTIV